MPNTYQYYNQGGQLQQIQANTPAEALANAQNRASDSGVQLVSSGQSSPTVVSNENKIKEVPKLNASLGKYSQKGITSDPNTGLSTYADGSAYNPQDFVDADTTDEDKQINDFIEQQKASLDASTKSLIDNIQQKFAQRKAEQAEINRRQEKGVQNALLMGGTTGQGSSSQFAPISSGGIVQAQESYGLKQIAELDAQEQDLIAEAKAAQESGNFELLGKKMSMIEEKRQKKIEAAAKLNEKIAEQNAKLKEQNMEMQKENAITDLYSQGVTDLPAMIKALKEQGVDVPAKKVSETIALMSGIGGTGIVGEYNFYKADAQARGLTPIGFNEYQDMDANRKKSIAKAGVAGGGTGGDGSSPLYTGLSSQTSTAVRGKVTKFSSEPIIQNFATIQDGYNFASSLSDKTQNPADDQALIYALAKALDPGSVVREGEYATAQKYAQSWVKAYGKKVTQALAGTGFLSEEARKNIKKTIEQKYLSTKKSYDNLYGQYEKGINQLTGRNDGKNFLTDYSTFDGGNNLLDQQEQVKNTIDSYINSNPNAPEVDAIATFYDNGFDDIKIYEWMKLRGIVQ